MSEQEEEGQQEDSNNSRNKIVAVAYTNDLFNELKKYTRQHIIKAYSLYYVAKNIDDQPYPPPEELQNSFSYWCLKKYRLELVSLKKPSSSSSSDGEGEDGGDGGGWLALPTALDQIVVKVPAEYGGDKPTEKMIEKQTGGLEPAGAVVIHDKSFGEFDYDSDVYGSMLKREAESEGYQRLTYYTGIATWGTVIPALFNFGIHRDQDMMERFSSNSNTEEEDDDYSFSSSPLYQDIGVNHFFTKIYPVETDPETGATTQRVYYHIVPKGGGLLNLPEGLIPDEMAQKGTRMLKQLKTQVREKKREIAQETALLKTQQLLSEKKYFDKLHQEAINTDLQIQQLKQQRELNNMLMSSPEVLNAVAVMELQQQKLQQEEREQHKQSFLEESARAEPLDNAETMVEEEEEEEEEDDNKLFADIRQKRRRKMREWLDDDDEDDDLENSDKS